MQGRVAKRLAIGMISASLFLPVGCLGLPTKKAALGPGGIPDNGKIPANANVVVPEANSRRPTVEMLVDFGYCFINFQNYEKAADLFNQALAQNPRCDRAIVGLARIQLERQNPAEAVRILETGLQKSPKSAPIWNELGMSAMKQGEFAAARSNFEQAMSYAPDNRDYIVNLAHSLTLLGDTESAHRHLCRQTNPAEARCMLADWLALADQPAQALEQVQQARVLDKNHKRAMELETALTSRLARK